MPISAGEQAPEFTLADEDGINHSLSDYRGSPLVLYFYPKDDTPGCRLFEVRFEEDAATKRTYI